MRVGNSWISAGLNVLFLSLLIILTALMPISCQDNKTKEKSYVIGIVNLTSKLERIIDGFKSRLAKYGYIEGENITYLYTGPLKSKAELEPTIKDLISKDIDLLFTLTTPATLQAKKLTEDSDIPVVFAPVFAPVKSGIVKSLTNHGCNLTGIKVGGSTAKALEWLLTIAPGTKNILVPFNSNNPAAKQSLAALKAGAEKLGVNIIVSDVPTKKELERQLDNIPQDTDALWLLNSHFLVTHVESFLKAAVKHRIPLASGASQYRAGVLITYGQDHFRTGEQAGRLAYRILQGIKPSDLPVETSDFFLGINLKTARAIGLEIPDSVLQQADFIIR